ncbi:MAG: N-acetylornithine carbamoyltransferase [Flavobacteriaceae bacterium]|nr:N-acetylornithine carbamoyltransferase [Flavobacteriaceae bacterium]MCY4266310.1 N-acetylornithine carbamoyltransferase [Flavobacteriaceae bacterium]
MKQFLSISDIPDLPQAIRQVIELKQNPLSNPLIGQGKRMAMVFFNPSLRTRCSTQIAAENLGLKTFTLDVGSQTWPIEFRLNTIMDGKSSEHIKEATMVLSSYFDLIAVRSFPTLKKKEQDLSEFILNSFHQHATVPVINMESATQHPLQSFADAITIKETQITKPKIVLSWTPHPKAIPHSVANSFVEMCRFADYDCVITNPPDYDLNPEITKGIPVIHQQEKAFENADIIYAKNWSSFQHYGRVFKHHREWIINQKKIDLTNHAKFMHCLPVRRNVVVSDEILDSENSLIQQQVENRVFSAQYVIKKILDHVSS